MLAIIVVAASLLPSLYILCFSAFLFDAPDSLERPFVLEAVATAWSYPIFALSGVISGIIHYKQAPARALRLAVGLPLAPIAVIALLLLAHQRTPAMDDLSAVAFPAIALGKDGSITLASEAIELRKTFEADVENGYFDGLEIYDGAGFRHRVLSVSAIDGWWHNRALRRSWRLSELDSAGELKLVRFVVSPAVPYGFAELCERVASTQGPHTASVVRSAESFLDLFDYLHRGPPPDR